MIDVEAQLLSKYPQFANQPELVKRPTLSWLRQLAHETEINEFLASHQQLSGFTFIDAVLEHFNFSYSVGHRDKLNIPTSGPLVIVANHPLGALDGLALLKLVGEVRRDVKIIANDLLNQFQPLLSLLLSVDNLHGRTARRDIDKLHQALAQQQALIVFPAGEVSRAGLTGIRDNRWSSGFIHLAKRSKAPILPVYIGGKNSALFYGASMLNRQLSGLLLANEMFNQRASKLPFTIGQAIPYSNVAKLAGGPKQQAQRVRQHLYQIAKGETGCFDTTVPVAHPQQRQALVEELKQAQLLGHTSDGKRILLLDYQPDSVVMQEIGRLREIAFRSVGEGTGRTLDLDRYDSYYRQLILWDEQELEIAGAYRLAEANRLVAQDNTPLYSASLFDLRPEMGRYLAQGLELGRSFVQPKYWGKRSLDYLWYGIGAYLRANPQVRYLFGPVSLSADMPKPALEMLIWYYQQYYWCTEQLAQAKHSVMLSPQTLELCQQLFDGSAPKADFTLLKQQLASYGCSVPTLYKQYTDVAEPDGVSFLDFSRDPDFNNCVDGLVMVDIDKLKPHKRARYIQHTLH